MSSLLTNTSAMTALENLKGTTAALEKIQQIIATGKRVANATDNAAYWSIAYTMSSDRQSLSTVKDALGLGSATLDVTYTATEKSLDILNEIKSRLVAARQPGVDRTKIQAEISQLQDQLRGMADSSVFSGQNWLVIDSSSTGYNPQKSFVSSFSHTGSGISIGLIDINISSLALYDDSATSAGILDSLRDSTGAIDNTNGTYSIANLDVSNLTDNAADLSTIENLVAGVDNAMGQITSSASDLGALKKRVDLQKGFVSSLMDAIDRGVGQLVDADMNEQSTKLQALQVQQQLGTQALSIANSSSQAILTLFRGQ